MREVLIWLGLVLISAVVLDMSRPEASPTERAAISQDARPVS